MGEGPLVGVQALALNHAGRQLAFDRFGARGSCAGFLAGIAEAAPRWRAVPALIRAVRGTRPGVVAAVTVARRTTPVLTALRRALALLRPVDGRAPIIARALAILCARGLRAIAPVIAA